MNTLRAVLYLWLLQLMVFPLHGQSVRGTLRDASGNPLEGASVIVSPASDPESVVAFGFTKSDGAFDVAVKVKDSADTVLVQFRMLGYREKTVRVALASSSAMKVVLEENRMHIDEVVVKGEPIRQNGDTIRYLVGSFVKGKDLTIGDVIKSMPGFEVSDDGTVYYEGKPIQNYYIEGLNLMGGGYSIVNRSMPHSAVGAVEVYKRHQPVKILEGIVPADGTSINLRLKRDVTLTGSTLVGAGYKPYLYDLNLTPMLFKKEEQAVITAQLNNTGKELESQFSSFELGSSVLSSLNLFRPRYVNVSQVPNPNIERSRYYDNSSMFIAYKHLFKLRPDVELKADINYFSDRSYRYGEVVNRYIFVDSVLVRSEVTTNRFYLNSLRVGGKLMQNTSSRYLNSSVYLTGHWDERYATLSGLSQVNQKADVPSLTFVNENDVVYRRGNRFTRLYTYTLYMGANQSLGIKPGPFATELNGSQPYDEARQVVRAERYEVKAFWGTTYNFKPWLLEFRPSFNFEGGHYKTQVERDGVRVQVDSLTSAKQWRLARPGVEATATFDRGAYLVSLHLPWGIRYLEESDVGFTSVGFSQYFSPFLKAKYKISPQWEVSGSAGYSKELTDPSKSSNGYVIVSHNHMVRNSWNQNSSDRYFGKAVVSYSNPIKGLHSNMAFFRQAVSRDNILERTLVSRDLIAYVSSKMPNKSVSSKVSAEVSWFIFSLQTSLACKYELLWGKQDELIMHRIQQGRTVNDVLTASTSFTLLTSWEFGYKFRKANSYYSLSSSRFRYIDQSHTVSVLFYWSSSILGADFERYIFVRNASTSGVANFINLFYSQKFQSGRYQLKVSCNNLLNARSFDIINFSDSFITQSTVLLRPRMFMVTLTMPLLPIARN
ncbi:MAG: carboxypeptidase-like regulatory domain-containing protein [Tenuifilum sp.]|uniref:hypothetical protein n=1 Tax=Tenuifilum sp. TaxID=2760880 RepID=UPI0030B01F86